MKDAFRLLRLPFSVYLMPVYWYAVAFIPFGRGPLAMVPGLAPPLHWLAGAGRAAVVFALLHLLIYPASNGFNSLHDRDTGPIGGLAAPPLPPTALRPLVTLLDTLGLGLAFLLDGRFGWLLLSYVVISRAYSAPPLRLKARPILGTAAVAVFQGTVTYLAVQAGCGLPTSLLLTHYNLLAAAGASLLLLGSYPLTQIYQHAEDGARGDLTLSRLLGVRGTFVFAQVVSVASALYVMGLGWLATPPGQRLLWNHPFPDLGPARWAGLFGLWMLPTAWYVARWRRQVETTRTPPTHHQAMRLNQLASLSVSAFFLLTVLVQVALFAGRSD